MVGAPVKSSQLRLTCRLPVTDFSNLCVQITVTGRTAQRRLEHGGGWGHGGGRRKLWGNVYMIKCTVALEHVQCFLVILLHSHDSTGFFLLRES
ncbi:hypothetical protein GN956_G3153 [Arapaima gigas]